MIGRGERFRTKSWLERAVERLREGRQGTAPPALKRVHEALLDRWPGDHLVSTLPGGERVRLAARYRYMTWNPDEYEAFRSVVRTGSTVLDVGANVGAYAILFALWATEGQVVAFEPSPEARRGLERHVALNDLGRRVRVEPFAVCDRTGDARFRAQAFSGANALVHGDARAADIITVPTTSLDEYCTAHRLEPDVVKIDVEGAELDVLRGARGTLGRSGVTAFVEFHPATWRSAGISRDAIRDELAAQGLLAVPLRPDVDPWLTEGVCARLVRNP